MGTDHEPHDPRGQEVWDLYVDESGNFSNPEAQVLVGGVLVRHGAWRPTDSDLVVRLRTDVLSWAPHPIHAAHASKPVGMLSAWLAAGRPATGPFSRAPLPGPTLKALAAFQRELERRGRGREPLAKFLRLSRGRGRLPSRLVEEAHRESHGLPSSITLPVLDLCEQYIGHMRDLVEELRQASDGGLVPVAAVDALDALPFEQEPESPPIPPAEDWPDRYLGLLTLLVERSLMLLRSPTGPPTLRVHVSYRDLEILTAAKPILLDMTAGRVDRAALDEANALRWPAGWRGPSAKVGSLAHFDHRASPWFVVADFLSWRLLGPVRWSEAWDRWASSLQSAAGARPEGTSLALGRQMPSIAASGHAGTIVRAATDGDGTVEGAASPRWAREQAQRWADAIVGSGGRA